MALINCPKCGKKVSDKAEKCPHCGCAKEDFLNCVGEEEKIEYIVMPLAGYNLQFDKRYEDYFTIRSIFEEKAYELKAEVREFYNKTENLGSILEKVPSIVENKMNEILNTSMQIFYDLDISMIAESFIKKYFNDSKYDINYNLIINNVVEKYAEIMGEKAQLEQYRNMQKATRGHWQGGGFGLSGAVKGAVMAGALNAGTDFVRSFGDSIQRNSDNANIQKKIKDLKESTYARGQIIGGAYSVIVGIGRAVFNELIEHKKTKGIVWDERRYEKAKDICLAAEKYESDKDKLLVKYLEAIIEFPYYERPYHLVYKQLRNKPKEVELFALMQYLGIDTEIEGITASIYMDIETGLSECEDLKNFDYEKSDPEQFYVATDIAEQLKEIYPVSILRKVHSYRKLDDYISKNASKDTLDYESMSEKTMPMIKYVPELIRKCMKTGYIGEASFDGYLWVPGVNVGCTFEDLLDVNNYIKYKGANGQYSLIYENTVLHMGKRGFGILDDAIVLFEPGRLILFKEIEKLYFDETKIAFVIITADGKYEFEYKFFGSKLFGRWDKEAFVNMGNFMTYEIIGKIVKHYQELNEK